MKIHIGNKIRNLVDLKKIPIADFASKIQKSTTAVYDIYKKEDINTALLKYISDVLDVPMSYWFDCIEDKGDNLVQTHHGNGLNIAQSSVALNNCQLRLDAALKEIEYQKKIIELLEGGKGGKGE